MDLDAWKRSIHKLEDRFGDYILVLQCACGHGRRVTPEALAKIVGWAAEIDTIVARMRCSKCGAKLPKWDVDRLPRPRR